MASRGNGSPVQNLNGFDDENDFDDEQSTPQPRVPQRNNSSGSRGRFEEEKVRNPQFTQRPGTLPGENGGSPAQQVQRNQQQQQGKGQKPNPNGTPASSNYVFTAHQLKLMCLLVLAGWLNDESLRKVYHDKLKKQVGDMALLTPLFEQIIESAETGVALAKPPGLLSAGLLQKFLNGRRIEPKEVDRLNTLYLSRYFNMDEAPGVTVERMLLDERLITKSNIVPVDLHEHVAAAVPNTISAKDIVSIDLIVRSDYNDALQAHTQTLSMDSKFAAFLDEIFFHQYLTYNGKFITEWVLHDRFIRVTSEAIKTYGNGDNVHQCSIVMLS